MPGQSGFQRPDITGVAAITKDDSKQRDREDGSQLCFFLV